MRGRGRRRRAVPPLRPRRRRATASWCTCTAAGFVFNDVDVHDGFSRRLANRCGRRVLSVDYRRPPEHRFPAAPDDVDTALGWLGRQDLPGRWAVHGDSAGANLALVAALRHPGSFAAVALVYPFLEPRAGHPSYDEGAASGFDPAEARWYWEQYADESAWDDPDVAPLRSDRLATLPPTLVATAEHDPLRDEGEVLARRLAEEGVETVGVRCLGPDPRLLPARAVHRLGAVGEAGLRLRRPAPGLSGASGLRDWGHARTPRFRPRRPRAQGPPDDVARRPRLRARRPRPLRLRRPRRLPLLLPAGGRGRRRRPGRGPRQPRRRDRRLGQRRADGRQQGRGHPLRPGLVRGDRGPGPRAQRRQRRLRRRSHALASRTWCASSRSSSSTPFTGDERHVRRIGQLSTYDTSGELPPLPASALQGSAGA